MVGLYSVTCKWYHLCVNDFNYLNGRENDQISFLTDIQTCCIFFSSICLIYLVCRGHQSTLLYQVLYSKMSRLFTALKTGLARSWTFGSIMIGVTKLALELYLGLPCFVLISLYDCNEYAIRRIGSSTTQTIASCSCFKPFLTIHGLY